MPTILIGLIVLVSWNGEVRVDGALRAMFHDNRIGAEVALDDLLPAPHVYGLGALAELAGEVTIVDGTAFLSYPDGDTARTEKTAEPTASATLLVTTAVAKWREVTTTAAIAFDELDDAIARLSGVEGRVPFLIEGPVEALRWHVIDGSKLTGGGGSHEDHVAAGVRGTIERGTVTLVGFYSTEDMGVFTHMGSRTHLHYVTESPAATGHVDHVTLPAGTTIRFPALDR